MFNDISCDNNGSEEECLAHAEVVSILAKKFGIGQWSFIGPGSEKKWYSTEEKRSTRNLGSYRGQDAVGIRRKRVSNFPCNNSIVQGKSQKQRTWKTVDTFCCILRNNWDHFLHNCFCHSAQSLRSSCRHVWRILIPSRSIRATWCLDGTINCSQWNQGSSFFGKWHPITPESSIATIWRTNRIAFTRKQSE